MLRGCTRCAEEWDAAEEFSLCEKPLAVAVCAQGDARGRAAGRLWRVRCAAARPRSAGARGVGRAEETDAAEEFSLCEKPLAIVVRAQGGARGWAAGG